MSHTTVVIGPGRPQRIVTLTVYIGATELKSRLTESEAERALAMQYLRGEPGTGGGSSGVSYPYASALQWTINHNLGFRPAVDLYDSLGAKIQGEVQHASVNTTIVSFNTPTAGFARLN